LAKNTKNLENSSCLIDKNEKWLQKSAKKRQKSAKNFFQK
jgi:hypothetical protein